MRTFVLLIVVGTAACSAPSPQARLVADADSSMVQLCQFLGTVSGSSGWGNLAASAGMKNAQNEAREEAAALGANRVVWTSIAGGYSPFVSGNAYRCPPAISQ